MRRYVVAFLLIAVGVVIASAFYQPPMRLMPAPAAFVEDGTSIFAANESLAEDNRIDLFYATNRLPMGPSEHRLYAIVPGRDLRLGNARIRIGDDATPWGKVYEWSTSSGADRRPFLHLENLNELAAIERDAPLPAEAEAWFAQINEALERSRDKDIIVYVHGANTTVERAAGQAAQLRHFTGRNSVVVLLVWPTAENFLRYSNDLVTALGAAPHLADLIDLLSEKTAAENIDVFTYSAGGTVGSDGLAILGRRAQQPGRVAPRLGLVYHAAPDADFRTFVDDMRDYAGRARAVTVSVNMNDAALRLAQGLARASRAGRPDIRELDDEATRWLLEATDNYRLDVLRVRPENIPGLSTWSHTFWYDDPWVSSDALIALYFHLRPEERGLVQGETSIGGHYWTFPSDYDARLPGVLSRLFRRNQTASDGTTSE